MKAKKKEMIKVLIDTKDYLDTRSVLQRVPVGSTSSVYRVGFEVKNQQDLIHRVSCLLEVCAFALNGNGMLMSPENEDKMVESSVSSVLEMAINLLPSDQMSYLDRVIEMLAELDNKPGKP